MLVIGEKINVMGSTTGPAIKDRDAGPIQKMARDQVEKGANLLDLNLGPATKNGPEMMEWLVQTVQEAVPDTRLCLDTTNYDALEAGLKVCKNRPMINSTSAERARLERAMPMAATYEADIIALTMTEAGISRTTEERVACAAEILGASYEFGVSPDRIFLDPLLLPIGVAQQQAMEAIESVRMFKQLSDPQMKTTVGLSNIFNGCPNNVKPHLAAALVTLLMEAGLDSAIMDPMDEMQMGAVRSVSILKNESLYCHSYLD